MQQSKDKVWKNEALSKLFLEGVRGAIPLYAEQLAILTRIVGSAVPDARRFLDLGAGDGILGRALAMRFPQATGIILDFSETMMAEAQKKNSDIADRLEFVMQDYGDKHWMSAVRHSAPFDVIVSGLSIHHQTDARKKEIYAEIYSLLAPGGMFLNLEHVVSRTKWIETFFENMFIDSLYEFHRRQNPAVERSQVAQDFVKRRDKEANILCPVEDQCQWLRDIGFEDVDCYFKMFELALFGGRKALI
jgi:tRNA (cmo5U34)-methyltransferase